MARDHDIAWAAGLFEGEGCFSITRARGKRRFSDVALVVASTDRDVVEAFRDIVGCGAIYSQASRKKNWKPAHRWASNRQEDVLHVIELLRPWLHERRLAKAEEAIVLLQEGRFTHCETCGALLNKPRRGQFTCGQQSCSALRYQRAKSASAGKQVGDAFVAGPKNAIAEART